MRDLTLKMRYQNSIMFIKSVKSSWVQYQRCLKFVKPFDYTAKIAFSFAQAYSYPYGLIIMLLVKF